MSGIHIKAYTVADMGGHLTLDIQRNGAWVLNVVPDGLRRQIENGYKHVGITAA